MTSSWDDTVSMHRARDRDRIIDAAIELVAEEGVTKASMAGLAQRAGIGRATVYKYFASIEGALLAHVEREVDECCRQLDRALSPDTEPLTALRSYITTVLGHFVTARHRLGWATLDQAELSAAAMASSRTQLARLYQPLVVVLRDGVEAGVLRADLAPQLHARLALKLLMSLHDDLASGELTLAYATEAVWRLLTHGMLAAGAVDPPPVVNGAAPVPAAPAAAATLVRHPAGH